MCVFGSQRLTTAALLLVIGLIVAACSGEPESTEDAAPTEELGQSAPTDSVLDETTTTIPDVIAFVEDPVTLRVGVPGFAFVEPHLLDETDPVEVLVTDLLTDGLTAIDTETGLVEPALAESWTTSGDGLTWTFLLGEHTFSNGEPITAGDVAASLTRVGERGIGSLSGPSLWPVVGWVDAPETGEVAGLVIVDDQTLEITLTTPYAALVDVLAGPVFGVFPAEVGASASDDLPLSSSVHFEPTALWEDGFRVQGEELGGEVSAIEVFADPDGSMLAAGEVDLGIGINPDTPLGDLSSVDVVSSAHVFFAMDASDAPLDDPLIRQAVLHAVDRESIRDGYFPDLALMDGFVNANSNIADACGGACELDIEQARLLVDASPSRDVPFTVDYFADTGSGDGDDASESVSREQLVAEQIAESLRAIGLDATAVGRDPQVYGSLAVDGELGLFRFGAITTTPSSEAQIGALFATAGRDNLTSTSIERLDDLLDEARAEGDPERRQLIYTEAEQVVFGEAAVAPLVTAQHHLRFNETLSSAGLEPDGSLDLAAIVPALDQFEE